MSGKYNILLHIKKRLGKFTLDVDCELHQKVTAFLGASGSGKTTLLNCISGTLSPNNGQIVFGNNKLYDTDLKINISPDKRRIGYIFQEGHLFPHLTVEKNIRYGQPKLQRKNSDSLFQVLDTLEIADFTSTISESTIGWATSTRCDCTCI